MTRQRESPVEEYIRRIVAEAPPLTDQQLARIAALLDPGAKP